MAKFDHDARELLESLAAKTTLLRHHICMARMRFVKDPSKADVAAIEKLASVREVSRKRQFQLLRQ